MSACDDHKGQLLGTEPKVEAVQHKQYMPATYAIYEVTVIFYLIKCGIN